MRTFRRAAGLAAAAIVSLPGTVAAATFVVNSTLDTPDTAVGNKVCAAAPGVCTLRAAIQEANATPASDIITFAIGSGPATIQLQSALPAITSPVLIDGTTQPGYSATDGKPMIEISGTALLSSVLTVTGASNGIRGLAINSCGGDGIELLGGGRNILESNYIGLDPTGTEIRRNLGAGVRIESPSNRIGGLTPDKRNVISGNGGLGIEGGILITGPNAVGNIVQGNYIGLDPTGMIPMGNLGRGVAIHFASYNMIGGDQPGAGNLIAGNRASGVRIMAGSTGNIVWRNFIGVNAKGETHRGEYPDPLALSNARGVQVRGDANYVVENVIGGNTEDGVLFYDGYGKDLVPLGFPSNNVVTGNYIFHNGFNGISVLVGMNNRFYKNSIFDNAHLGINLETHEFGGVTFNDDLDADEGTNGLQNFPDLTSAAVVGAQTTIVGVLKSKPSTAYTIEVSANPSCGTFLYGEGSFPLLQSSVTSDASGNAPFTITLPYAIPRGWVITSTATDPGGSTSEYSRCVVVQ